MKKHFYILFFISAIALLLGCEAGSPVVYHYTLENQSGVPINLKTYKLKPDGEILYVKNIQLADGEKLEKTYKDFPPHPMYNFVEFFSAKAESINTVEVLYNNQKKQVFFLQRTKNVVTNTCENDFGEEVPCDPRNILNTFIYNNVTEHYIFTVDDYQQAYNYKGNCQ